MPVLQKFYTYSNNNGDIYEENLEYDSNKGGIHIEKHNDQVKISMVPPMKPGSACSTARLLNPYHFTKKNQNIKTPETELNQETDLEKLLKKQIANQQTDAILKNLMESVLLDSSKEIESEVKIEDITDDLSDDIPLEESSQEDSDDSDILSNFIENYKTSQESQTELYEMLDDTKKEQKKKLNRLKKNKLQYISEQLELSIENEKGTSLTRKELIKNILKEL